MAKERESRSYVRKRRRGCLSGCLLKIVLLLGVLSLLLVGACVLGFVRIDETTGAPELSLDNVDLSGLPIPDVGLTLPKVDTSRISLPRIDLSGLPLPRWAYSVERTGLTVKTLRAGGGEAVLVCCDGYTMLLGGGENGLLTAAQMLLCGVNRLDVAVMMSAQASSLGGLPMAIKLGKPSYLLIPPAQTSTDKYNAVLKAAQDAGAQVMTPAQGLPFMLGRAQVTIIGPAASPHTDERDDGLSVRIDLEDTSVIVLGGITAVGESELVSSPANMKAGALICARGGSDDATSARLIQAVSPSIALMTGKNPSETVSTRLTRSGAQVYTARQYGVMTLRSDGARIEIDP